jgi:hypothetical protein
VMPFKGVLRILFLHNQRDVVSNAFGDVIGRVAGLHRSGRAACVGAIQDGLIGLAARRPTEG